jgi:SAM-dependent methyltransferase
LRGGTPTPDFLAARLAEDIADRLAATTRRFERALVMGFGADAVAAALAASGRVGALVRADPLALASPADLVIDDEALPFAAGAFDLIAAPLSLTLVNDLPGALVQVRRALRPDGLFLAVLAGAGTLAELREVFALAESELRGGVSPRVAPFADIRDLGGLLQRAGFALPVADVETLTLRYPDALALMRDLAIAGLANPLTERSRRPTTRALLARVAAAYRDRAADADGRIIATLNLVWLSGWAPHESQPKPLRPGSGKVSLKDVLGR